MKSIASRLLLTTFLLCAFILITGLDSSALLHAQSGGAGDDTLTLPYPFNDNITDGFSNSGQQSPLFLTNPSNIESNIEYDPESHEYNITEKMGDVDYRNPSYMTFSEYYRSQFKKTTKDYWKQKADEDNISGRKRSVPKLYVGGAAFDRIFGGNTVDIRPQGSAELIFGVNISRNDNPQIPEQQRRNTTFDFREKIQMNVIGNIGEKLRTSINYNTEATFDFENKMKLDYTGKEDEIIKKLEAGNVSLPLTGSLIQGSQSLFGLKTQLQFGRMTVTTVFSQQKSETKTINVAPGGAQTQDFDIKGDNYEANKHFFLAQYFRDNYDDALAQLPIILSGVAITKIEVWITNRTSTTNNTRNIVAFMDLGENDPYKSPPINGGFNAFPDNGSNDLYSQITALGAPIRDIATINTTAGLAGTPYTSPTDYEKLENARMLNPSEYTFNSQLGYISLQSALNADEILSVAFEYTANGQVYKVGELSSDGINPPQVLITKMLKSTNTNPRLPTWDLMMKNIYALGAFQLSQTDFRLDVLYEDDATGSVLNFLPTGNDAPAVNGIPLIKVLRLDNLNNQRDPQPDGLFDFIEGITINSQNGRVIFPVVEPFGEFLREAINPGGTNPTAGQVANRYVFDALYDSTLTVAQQQPERNKYRLKGTYQSQSSSEIQLNSFNIPRGSVVVTAGGIPLIENQQYTVDYNLGRVKIIDQSILNSNTPISVKLEDESLFSIQSKTLMGAHFDYDVAKDFRLGATIMRLSERPITKKVNIGDEPIANTIWGVDGTYNTESRYLTKLVDKLPLINTKEPSTLTFTGEFAHIIPGHAKAIGKNGVAYLDDFEGSQTFIDLKNIGNWFLSSTPQGQNGLFPEASLINDRSYGFNRAKMAWYTVDPTIFYTSNALRPSHLTDADIFDHRVRQILEQEIFPNAQNANGIPNQISVLNLAYYPSERGPYNYDAQLPTTVSAGTAADGTLNDPESRWAGIMSRLETTDFEEANVEFIQFWLMDPFNSDEPNTFNDGELYINLGNISEDVLRDSRKTFENGLPTQNNNAPVDTTAWGLVPVNQSLVPAFDNDAGSRPLQDVGLDGLPSDSESVYFSDFIANVIGGLTPQAQTELLADPSTDNFQYYRGSDLDNAQASILERYKNYNGTEGNSPIATGSISASSTNVPDAEDINRDNTMSESESYYQYKIDIKPNMEIGTNFITDKVTRTVSASGQPDKTITWYQFKVPVASPTSVVNGISDFKSIRFIRMFMKEFEDPVVLRFASLDLVRGEWRKYPFDLLAPGEYVTVEDNSTLFDISTVSLEENGDRTPINYVIPPGIDQEVNVSTSNLQKLNEQSLSLRVCNLEDGDARAGYKILNYDILNYNRLKMFVHAESGDAAEPLIDGDMRLFVRIGADFVSNYYEYELPLAITNPGTTDPEEIWPELNDLDISLERLVQVKINRDQANAPFNVPYSEPDGDRTITVTGTPNLANVKTIMIGVRNPKRTPNRPFDDGRNKCAEIWVNELRLTDFEEKGGWAANARITAKLASLGTVTLTGNRKTIGFGGIEQTLNERSRSNDIGYEVAAQLKMDEFLPENTGLSIPMYFGYSEQFSDPQYNPLQPDVELETALSTLNSEDKAELKKIAQDYTRRKSLNFTNVKKNKVNPTSKSRIYDISNFDFTYAYSETFHRDINTEFDRLKTYKGAIGYNYNQQPKSYKPFNKLVGSGKTLRPIKDFNFSLRPSALTFRTDLDRQYGERLLRNNTDFVAAIDTTFNKFFNWSRQYGMQWDLTKSIKLDFNANNQSRIDEPAGRIDTKTERDSIIENIKSFGRNTNYNHQGNATYNVPLNKFPLLNFINVNTKYGFDYSWTAAPLIRSNINTLQPNSFGNTIQNSNTKQINTSLSMPTLYNKLPFYKNLNKPRRKGDKGSKSKLNAKPPQNAKDSARVKKANQPKQVSPVVKHMVNFIFSVKNISVNYSETNGTSLPGYIRPSEILGMDLGQNSPGIPFVLGSQNDIRDNAANGGWLSDDTLLNVQYAKNFQQNLTGRANIEPFPGFRIDLNANRSFSRTNNEYFRYNPDPLVQDWESFTPQEQGNFSMSFLTWNTAFATQSLENSDLFETFDRNRAVLSNRLADLNPNSVGLFTDSTGVVYREGYTGTQQEVLLYSFIAAYTGQDPQGVSLKQFPKIPKPNWRITYDGIGKMKWAKKIFRNVNISHGYRSSFNINSYTTDVNYGEDNNGNTNIKDFAGINYLARNEMTQVTISEQFSPLVGVEVTLKNSLSLRAEFKKDRNLSLAFTGIQLTEVRGEEITIGAGYRIKNFKNPFDKTKRDDTGGDLNLTLDISRRDNETIIRKMIEQTNQRTAGLKVWSIKSSADYAVNERFNVRLYFDHTVNNPKISLSFPTSNTNAGVSIRFTLSQ